jgi:FkbH-like protein
VERIRVQTSLPEVLVVEMPEASHDYLKVLQQLNDFSTLTLTNEDLKRGEMYVARQKRKSLERNIQTVGDFIKSLEITAHIDKSTEFSIPRITSLINRTNQFNLTTRRYTEQEINELHNNQDEMRIYTLRVTDKFGDEGIVGVAMVKIINNELLIDNFMMSCRVIGRMIETAFLTHLINSGIKNGFKALRGEFIRTKKNKLVETFFEDHGFELINQSQERKGYLYTFDKIIPFPEFLEIQIKS